MMTELWWSIHYIFKYQISAVHLEYNVICQLHLKKKKACQYKCCEGLFAMTTSKKKQKEQSQYVISVHPITSPGGSDSFLSPLYRGTNWGTEK